MQREKFLSRTCALATYKDNKPVVRVFLWWIAACLLLRALLLWRLGSDEEFTFREWLSS